VVEDHVRQCVRCQGELVLLQRTIAVLRGLDDVEVPASLSAAVQAGIRARRRRRWRGIASWLFFPIHVKLPIQAVALLLVSLGAVYLYRTAPELAQAPTPSPVATESDPRGEAVPSTAAGRANRLDQPARQEAAEKSSGQREAQKGLKVAEQEDAAGRALRKSAVEPAAAAKPAEQPEALREGATGVHAETQEKRESQRQRDLVGALRKEAPASRAAPLVRELTLKTQDPSQAASRITEIATAMGGRLVEASDPRESAPEDLYRLALAIPPEAYPRFLNAVRELGTLSPVPGEPPAAPSPEGTVIVYLRLIR
jgi:hypothetical protein